MIADDPRTEIDYLDALLSRAHAPTPLQAMVAADTPSLAVSTPEETTGLERI